MIKSTQIARLDGLMLCASVEDEQSDAQLQNVKSQVKLVLRRLSKASETRASIESGDYTIHYLIERDLVFVTVTPRSYPRKLAFMYLSDVSTEFLQTHPPAKCQAPTLRPYAFTNFDTFIQRTKQTYSDPRAGADGANHSLNRINEELRDVTKVMTKNIEELLYRGDSLDRMGEVSHELRMSSSTYRKAAVKINWDLLVKQYAPFAAGGLILLVVFWIWFW